MSQKQLEANAAVVDKAIRDFKEADHEWSVAERDRTAVQRKHDGCIARMLLLLERKDTQTGLGIKRVLNVLADNFVVQFIHAIRRGDEQLMTAVKAVDLNKDLTDFLHSTYDSITPATVKIKPGDTVDLSVHLRFLSSNAFAVVDNLVLRSIDSLRVLIDLMQQLAETEEADSKQLKKVITPVRSMTNTSVQLALTSFDVWLERQVEVGEEQGRVLRSLTDSLSKMKTSMKEKEKAKEKAFLDTEKAWKKVQDERERAAYEERKADDAFNAAKQRVERAQREAEGGPGAPPPAVQKGFFSSLTTSSLDSLRNKANSAEADLRIARSFTRAKEKAMEEERVRREAALSSILREMQQLEEKKWQVQSAFYSAYMERHRAYTEKASLHVNTFRTQVKQMDVHLDLMDFLAKHNGSAPPPLVVIEGELKRKEEAEREEREREEEKKRREVEEERSRTGRSRRSRLSPSRSGHSRAYPLPSDGDLSSSTPTRSTNGREGEDNAQSTPRRPAPPPPAPVAAPSSPREAAPLATDPAKQESARSPPTPPKPVVAIPTLTVGVEGGKRGSPTSSSSTSSHTSPTSTSVSPPVSPAGGLPSLTSGPFPPPRPPRPAHTTRILSPRHSEAATAVLPSGPPVVPPHPSFHLSVDPASSLPPLTPPLVEGGSVLPTTSSTSFSSSPVVAPLPAEGVAVVSAGAVIPAAELTASAPPVEVYQAVGEGRGGQSDPGVKSVENGLTRAVEKTEAGG